MKTCPKCNQTKDLTNFYQRSDREGQSHAWCKECVNTQTKERQRLLKQQCIDYKGGKCEKCGITGHPAIFDFHHKDPNQKDFMISKVRSLKFSDKHKHELDKCALLCSNCHREEHASF